jgi:hypothetical protein
VKALLDRLAEQAGFSGEPAVEDQVLREEVVRDFIAGGVELLDEAKPFLRAYCESGHAAACASGGLSPITELRGRCRKGDSGVSRGTPIGGPGVAARWPPR